MNKFKLDEMKEREASNSKPAGRANDLLEGALRRLRNVSACPQALRGAPRMIVAPLTQMVASVRP
jgi:hypothetical protein